MATMTRFVPFRSGFEEVSELQQRLQRVFEGAAAREQAGSFVPAVDVYEDAQHLVLKFEVPGIQPADLDIRVEGRTLTVRGERKWNTEQKEENFHRVERRYGSFVRSFTLPATVDTENVRAETEHGVLSLTLNKKPESKPKQIQVKVAGADSAATQPKQVEGATAQK